MLQEMSRTLSDMGQGGGVGTGQPLSDPFAVGSFFNSMCLHITHIVSVILCTMMGCLTAAVMIQARVHVVDVQGVGGLLGSLLGGSSAFMGPQQAQNQSPVLSANSCFDINRTLSI